MSSLRVLSVYLLSLYAAAGSFANDVTSPAGDSTDGLDIADGADAAERTTVTVTLPPTTVTVNPSDFTSSIFLATVTVWPSTSTLTQTRGCTDYSYLDRRPASTVIPYPDTVTATVKSTVTVTRTDLPPTTTYTVGVLTRTGTGVLTVGTTTCTNTLAVSDVFKWTSTYTYTSYKEYTRVTQTEVCMTVISPPQTTAPGATPTPTSASGNPFASTTLVTSTRYLTQTFYATVSTDTLTDFKTVCNNPTVTEVWTYYTRTITPTTSVYVTGSSCQSSGVKPTATANVRRIALPLAAVDMAGSSEQTLDNSDARAANSEVELQSSTTTSTTAVIKTLPPQGVTRTFTVVQMVGATVTASTTSTWYITTCALTAPTAIPEPPRATESV